MGTDPELLPLITAEPYFAGLGEAALRPLAAAARERVRTTYSLERMIREYEDLYRSLTPREGRTD